MKTLTSLCLCMALASITACSNVETPAGHEGYVTQGAIIGKTTFYGTQIGPTSSGLGWLLSVKNIDMQVQTYSEAFELLTKDKLLVTFQAHLLLAPEPGSVRVVVENFGGNNYYERKIQQPFRNAVYDPAGGYAALELQGKRPEIAEEAIKRLEKVLEGSPFKILGLTVGKIALPKKVAEAQERKLEKETLLESKEFDKQNAAADAEINRIEAQGLADAQKLIAGTLTPEYLQYKAIEAQLAMAASPNHTTVYIPSGPNGIPVTKLAE